MTKKLLKKEKKTVEKLTVRIHVLVTRKLAGPGNAPGGSRVSPPHPCFYYKVTRNVPVAPLVLLIKPKKYTNSQHSLIFPPPICLPLDN